MENYSEEEFLVTEVDFLGCNPNSHKIAIAEEVFRQCASTVLGKFLVAKVAYGDATGHASDEAIVGYIPPEQEVRFVRNNHTDCLRRNDCDQEHLSQEQRSDVLSSGAVVSER